MATPHSETRPREPQPARQQTALVVYGLVLAAVRIALAPGGPTSWDEANGGFGLEGFDILQHRPHPPGYPLWMVAGHALDWIMDPHTALVVVAALASSLAALPMWALARAAAPLGVNRHRFAWAATALYTLQPFAWSFGTRALSGALSMALAPWMVLLLLRARSGNRRALAWASLGLGLAGGLRQELLVFLLPLWFVSWRPLRGAAGPLLAILGAAAWMLPTVLLSGGLTAYLGSTGYMNEILHSESLLFGGSPERAAATLHRLAAALVLGLGPIGLLGLRRMRSVAVWPTLLWSAVPTLLFCALGYFHKKAYLFAALPALTVLGLAPWWRTARGRMLATGQVALWAGLFFVLPSAEVVYRTDDGWLRPHEAVGYPARLLYPWLEESRATIADRDHRRAAVTAEIRARLDAQPDLTIWVEPGARFSMREAMWAAPAARVLEAPRAADGNRPAIGPATVGQRGSWTKVEVDVEALGAGPVIWIPASPPRSSGGWQRDQVTPWFAVFWRTP